MKKINRKGFTLVELIATIVLLSLVMGIGAFVITEIIENSKKKEYELLIRNIRDAAEVYYQECKYSNNSGIDCSDYQVSLSELVKYGYLKENTKDDSFEDDSFEIINPLDDEDISSCMIEIFYENGVFIRDIDNSDKCPDEY